jgi:hypothetical protein
MQRRGKFLAPAFLFSGTPRGGARVASPALYAFRVVRLLPLPLGEGWGEGKSLVAFISSGRRS